MLAQMLLLVEKTFKVGQERTRPYLASYNESTLVKKQIQSKDESPVHAWTRWQKNTVKEKIDIHSAIIILCIGI